MNWLKWRLCVCSVFYENAVRENTAFLAHLIHSVPNVGEGIIGMRVLLEQAFFPADLRGLLE